MVNLLYQLQICIGLPKKVAVYNFISIGIISCIAFKNVKANIPNLANTKPRYFKSSRFFNMLPDNALSMSITSSVALIISVATVVSAWFWARSNQENRKHQLKPRKWMRVGTIERLVIYPIKSCQGISVDTAIVTGLGLKYPNKNIRDRDFLLVDGKGNQLTMINLPKMALITPKVQHDDSLMLMAPGMPDLTLTRPKSTGTNHRTCRIKNDTAINVLDCGDEVASWFQTFLNRESLRLCFHHLDVTQRTYQEFQEKCPQFSKTDFGSFHNASAFMMVAEESVQELNRNLPQERQCTWKSFRPTILISGTSEPFGEVNWSFVKVGDGDTVFNVASPCFRCLLTTVDQKAGILASDGEPLKTLRSMNISKRVVDQNVREMLGSKGVMGILMGLYRDPDQNQNREGATISVGDAVYTALL